MNPPVLLGADTASPDRHRDSLGLRPREATGSSYRSGPQLLSTSALSRVKATR